MTQTSKKESQETAKIKGFIKRLFKANTEVRTRMRMDQQCLGKWQNVKRRKLRGGSDNPVTFLFFLQ